MASDTETNRTDSTGGSDDSKAAARSEKLKEILAKIKKKNASGGGDSASGFSLKGASNNLENSIQKFKAFQFNDKIVGQDIVDTRFVNGHCKDMMFGAIQMMVPKGMINTNPQGPTINVNINPTNSE